MELQDLSRECTFKAVRSGGKGGQNVNKVSSKVELYFHLGNSVLLTADQIRVLQVKLSHLINEDGNIRIVCDVDRSQLRNKKIAGQKLQALITKALIPVKKRVQTKTPAAVKRTRLTRKRLHATKKDLRRKPNTDE